MSNSNNWTGLVTRKYAEHVMRAASVQGGFVAVDVSAKVNGWETHMLYASLPESFGAPIGGVPMTKEDLRLCMIRDAGGSTRIQNLLDRI